MFGKFFGVLNTTEHAREITYDTVVSGARGGARSSALLGSKICEQKMPLWLQRMRLSKKTHYPPSSASPYSSGSGFTAKVAAMATDTCRRAKKLGLCTSDETHIVQCPYIPRKVVRLLCTYCLGSQFATRVRWRRTSP